MAETFLSPIIQKLVELLIGEAIEGVNSLRRIRKYVKSLKDELEIIQPFLRDAEAKSEKGETSDAAKVWLKQIREEADRVEDVVDEFAYRLEQRRRRGGFVDTCVTRLKQRRDIAYEIRDIEESLRKIRERGQGYGLRPFEQCCSSGAKTGRIEEAIDPRLGSLFIPEHELVGIESMSRELMRSLVEGPSIRTVISLVGQGGIGKTTLARSVYDDVAVKARFDCRVWITVSQSSNVEKILKMVGKQICLERELLAGESATIEELVELLRSHFQEKRYVVVFDDVWRTYFWDVMKLALPRIENGSRVIITTRNVTVADSFRESSCDVVHELRTWSPKLARELLFKKAFFAGFEGHCPPELEDFSHEIVRKCQGLPLVIVAVAGLLSKREKSKLEWQKVLDNLNVELEKNHELTSVLKVLLLSYYDLPYHLKLCVLYFGIFPRDFSICEEKLYGLWIAEGFVEARRDKQLEQVAKEYLDELINRNLVSYEKTFGVERRCKVHDLIHELILTMIEGSRFCQISDDNKLRFVGRSRRLSIYGDTHGILDAIEGSRIRSVLFFNNNELTKPCLVGLFKKFRLMKVLDCTCTPISTLPKEVGNLFYLKYLCLRGTNVKVLPKSIGKLLNLQTLDVKYTLVRELPIEIKNLRNLCHIFAASFNEQIEPSLSLYCGVKVHEGIGSLTELQTLTRVEAYRDGIGFANELQNLRKLKCLYVSKVTAMMVNSLGAAIEKMNLLEELHLTSINEDEVLDLHCIPSPPLLLRYLKLSCPMKRLPGWILELHNLQGLELTFSRMVNEPLKYLKGLPKLEFFQMYGAYDGEELHFEEGGFKKLKHVRLVALKGLKVLKIDRGGLPVLEELNFGPSPLITEMPIDVRNLTNLKTLGVLDMPSEFVIGLQPDGGPDYWKIQHIPSVIASYRGRGLAYNRYKLGSSALLRFLQAQVSHGSSQEMVIHTDSANARHLRLLARS